MRNLIKHIGIIFSPSGFNYIDGSEGHVGAAASLDLAANNFYREFSDSIPIPAALEHLSELADSGDFDHLVYRSNAIVLIKGKYFYKTLHQNVTVANFNRCGKVGQKLSRAA